MFYIFDWDGTISDSADKIVSCVQGAAIDLNLPLLDDKPIKNIIGLGLSEAIQMLYPGLDSESERLFKEAYSTHFVEDQTPSPLFPGAMETLTQLRENRSIIAVATGKSRKGLDRVLESHDLQDFFHYTRCADETASKPNPLMLAELISLAGVNVNEAVMIGDTEWDMRMADNIGMSKIAVSFGAHEKHRLLDCAPDLFVDEFSDILDWRFS